VGLRPQFHLPGPAQTSQTPVDILKARYVSREITHEEYDQMRRDPEG
jgi:uncharacterized membrane protein